MNSQFIRGLAAGGLLVVLSLVLPSETLAQRSGVEIWAANCGRCHILQPTNKYNAKDWRSVGVHMGIYARLTSAEAEAGLSTDGRAGLAFGLGFSDVDIQTDVDATVTAHMDPGSVVSSNSTLQLRRANGAMWTQVTTRSMSVRIRSRPATSLIIRTGAAPVSAVLVSGKSSGGWSTERIITSSRSMASQTLSSLPRPGLTHSMGPL